MPFRFYTSILSQASRSVASGIMIVGLLLIGFGVVIIALPALFAYSGCDGVLHRRSRLRATALKIFWAQRRIDR